MRKFLIRARNTPVDAAAFGKGIGGDVHVEYLVQVVQQALLISKGHRADTIITLVLEHSADYSRAINIDGRCLGSLAGWHETALVTLLADILSAGSGLAKEESLVYGEGLTVSATSFERLLPEAPRLFILDRKGSDIREVADLDDALFVMTDHIPMPKNTLKHLSRLGAKTLSLGPTMLHTSQCISVIHNELDRRA
jgi:tRNA (pseudouridine54-N1)-methyltransferase